MSKDRLVYSTRTGRVCPVCEKPLAECVCGRRKPPDPRGAVIRVRLETKGRGGKTVTVIAGVPLDDPALEDLASDLKRICGAGGSVKDGAILIQGDRVDTVLAELGRRGYPAKRSGG
jgi:translation initiation factor 1